MIVRNTKTRIELQICHVKSWLLSGSIADANCKLILFECCSATSTRILINKFALAITTGNLQLPTCNFNYKNEERNENHERNNLLSGLVRQPLCYSCCINNNDIKLAEMVWFNFIVSCLVICSLLVQSGYCKFLLMSSCKGSCKLLFAWPLWPKISKPTSSIIQFPIKHLEWLAVFSWTYISLW